MIAVAGVVGYFLGQGGDGGAPAGGEQATTETSGEVEASWGKVKVVYDGPEQLDMGYETSREGLWSLDPVWIENTGNSKAEYRASFTAETRDGEVLYEMIAPDPALPHLQRLEPGERQEYTFMPATTSFDEIAVVRVKIVEFETTSSASPSPTKEASATEKQNLEAKLLNAPPGAFEGKGEVIYNKGMKVIYIEHPSFEGKGEIVGVVLNNKKNPPVLEIQIKNTSELELSAGTTLRWEKDGEISKGGKIVGGGIKLGETETTQAMYKPGSVLIFTIVVYL